MTSQIVSDTIDETYPVAGQDNDSQGFRDNFSIIKDGLATAASEITDLQNNTAKLNEPNNFNGTIIDNAQTNRLYGTVYTTDTEESSTVIIDYNAGEYQIVTVTRTCTLRFQNWPSRTDEVPVYARVRVALVPELRDPPESFTVTFATVNGNVKSQLPTPTVTTGSDPEIATIVDAWTASDGSNDVYISLVGNFDRSFTLGDLTDVILTNVTTGDYLQFTNGAWRNNNQGPSTFIESLHDNVNNVEITADGGVPNDGDILIYDSSSELWTNVSRVRDIEDLENVSVLSAEAGDVIRYTGIPNVSTSWRSEKDPNIVQNSIYVSDNLSVQDEFFFGDPNAGGSPISNAGNIPIFHIGNIYRFDLSDSSNTRAPLKFSITAPSTGITPFTDNVTESGTPGTPGAYVDLLVTKDTPAVLYMYGAAEGTAGQPEDAGRDVPLIVKNKPYYSGSEELVNTGTASSIKSVSYFATSAASTSTLPAGVEGQIKTFAMREYAGDMVVTVVGPGWSTSGTGTITFSALGQACTLQYIENRWICIGNNGAVFA